MVQKESLDCDFFRKYIHLCAPNVHNKEFIPLKENRCIFLALNIFCDHYVTCGLLCLTFEQLNQIWNRLDLKKTVLCQRLEQLNHIFEGDVTFLCHRLISLKLKHTTRLGIAILWFRRWTNAVNTCLTKIARPVSCHNTTTTCHITYFPRRPIAPVSWRRKIWVHHVRTFIKTGELLFNIAIRS